MRTNRRQKIFRPGQWIYGIETVGNDLKTAKIAGFIYLGECKNYIICCSEYEFCDNFDRQLRSMYYESVKEKSVCLNLLRKEYTFSRREDAYVKLCKLQKRFNKNMEKNKDENNI